ncbi:MULTISPECIES: pheST operon leader peptide PheM [Providencia]|nr:pheST operon leader peptide PheM [Providencia stuartii]HEC8330643.1 pheST operon leader peptide PheM [Providencia rettgeri]MBN4874501.1 pheST operon leader peptide PheM [Providencia stuartii]MBN4879286.1 pheST operon leader peptide PheM [Providencia stuartii]MBN4883702.1 pheST operon leader peptide PheM [Providencia stuartii]
MHTVIFRFFFYFST